MKQNTDYSGARDLFAPCRHRRPRPNRRVYRYRLPGSLRIVACFLVLIGLISALLRQVARRVLHPFGWFSYFNEPLIRSNLSALRPGFMAG